MLKISLLWFGAKGNGPGAARHALAITGALLLAACSAGGPAPYRGGEALAPATADILPHATGQSFGSGPVRVALLLPLSGDAALAGVGRSMANAAQLAMEFIAASASIEDNITLVLKDTGPTAGGAAQAASQAIAEQASLILGPLKADQVVAAGSVARAAGVPVIGFSNTSSAAAPGVYLLNVLPESEARRSLAYAKSLGRQAFAGVFSASDFGRLQEAAFRKAAADLGLAAPTVHSFSTEAEARVIVQNLAPLLGQGPGQIDALFLPDRATAPSFGVLLAEAGVPQGAVQLIGSADWDRDSAIASTPYLSGALYPAVDEAGYQALLPEYQARFGTAPHALATVSYTATMLANASALARSTPPYSRDQLTLPAGFNGRDGTFRFRPDGRSETALAIKQVQVGGARVVDGPRL